MKKDNFVIFILRLIGLASIFFTSILLSKNLSIENYGNFEIFIRIGLIISTISTFGFGQKINRNEFIEDAISDYRKSLPWTVVINISLILILALSYYIISGEITLEFAIIIASLFYSLCSLSANLYLKKRNYALSLLSDDSLHNFCFLIAVFIVFSFWRLNLFNVSIIYFLSRFLMFILFGLKSKIKFHFSKNLLKDSKEFLLQNLLQKLSNNLPLILSGIIFANTLSVGIFALAIRLSSVYLIVLSVYNIYITPIISEEIQNSKLVFKRKFNKVSLILFSFSISVFLININFSKYLTYFWDEFDNQNIYIYLIVLAGYLVNLSTSSVGVILNMSGNAKFHIRINLIIILLQLITAIMAIFHQSFITYISLMSFFLASENIIKYIKVNKILN